jgi:hypothetical protein
MTDVFVALVFSFAVLFAMGVGCLGVATSIQKKTWLLGIVSFAFLVVIVIVTILFCDSRKEKPKDLVQEIPVIKEPVRCEKCKPCKCEPCKFGKFDAEYLMQIKRCSGDSKLFDKFWDNCTGWEMSTEMLCEPGPNLEFCTDRSKERYEWIMQDRKWLEKEYGD